MKLSVFWTLVIVVIWIIFMVALAMFAPTDTSTSESKEAKPQFDYSNFDYALKYPEEIFEPTTEIYSSNQRYFMRDRKTGVVYLQGFRSVTPLYDSDGKVVIRKVKK